jgi:OmcA/MtrC family decaheme c-type cytochrome
MVHTYRTDARFGYQRHYLDLVQSNYVPPANNNGEIGAEQGNWQGLSYQDGTYEADIWFYKSLDLGLHNEVQTYRCTSTSGQGQFLYGSATEIAPHEIISNTDTCLSCHNDVLFHGGGRRGIDTCLTCHSISGNTSNLLPGSSDPIEFRQMLHKIHMGELLPDAATYQFATEGEFPAMPGGPEQCVRCHGNTSWHVPAPREHDSASVPVRIWGDACGSCHDSDAAQAHIQVQTSPTGFESCDVCHGLGRDWNVEKMHHPY